jgi:hypothetical protein
MAFGAITAFAALLTLAGLNLSAETLSGESRTFPRDAAQPRSIFVVTFSKAASPRASDWTRKLRQNQVKLKAEIFQVAVLEDVPKLFRSAVISALASGLPNELHDHFWVAVARTADWQRCVDSAADDEPHVFVLDDLERVVWRAHGQPTDVLLRELLDIPVATRVLPQTTSEKNK